ncbi:MAG TPA: ABC transporter permease [Longimicrobiales bacterium]
MGDLLQDLRYAFRSLRRTPGFTAVAVLTLALGIGGNTAIFSVVDGVLLEPLPFAEPERLVRVLHRAPENGFAVTPGAFSPQDFEDLKRDNVVYERLAGYYFVPGQSETILVGGGEPRELETAFVSAEFFAALGVPPALGRVPGADENVPGADRVVVLSDGFWRRRFGSDPGVVGRTLSLDGESFTVIGVMPPSFDFPSPETEIWVPLSLIGEDDIPHVRGLRWIAALGRLAPGATIETATSATNTVLRRLESAYPETNEGWGSATVVPLRESLVGEVRPALLVLLGAVALVLLIACANLANLLLARGNARSRELAIRAALGAGRSRVVRQLLTESVALALAGGGVGLALAFWGVDAFVSLSAGTIPRPDAIRLDARVIGFTLAVSVLTGVVFGLVPSLTASRVDVGEALKEGGRGTAGGRRHGMRRLFVVAETALAVVLLAGAGLLIRSFWNLTRVDPGFSSENVLTLSLSTPSEIAQGDRRNVYRREILDRVANLPGVLAVGASKTIPLRGGGEPFSFSLPGRTDASSITPESGGFIVSSGYFRALGIPLVRGRVFTAADETNGAPVVIVNQAMARRYWPGEDPVGKSLGSGESEFRIVGVVGDVRNDGIAQAPGPAVYVPMYLAPRSSMKLFVRTATDPVRLAGAIRRAIWDVSPDQPISGVTTMQRVVSDTVARPRFLMLLLGSFSGLALILAALGVYGVIAYTVSRRTYEVGILIALGATRGDVLRLIIVQGIAPALAGLAVGIVAALALTRILSSLLYGVDPADPATFAGVALVLAAVTLIAVHLPAHRAADVDPMVALREQ